MQSQFVLTATLFRKRKSVVLSEVYISIYMENVLWHFYINPFITCLYEKFNYSRTPLFRTRLIRSPLYFEGRSNSLGFTLMFSVIYYQQFRTRLFRIPRYFELILLSLHFSIITPLFQTCQKQSTYIRAQLETSCILFELVLRN